jgi:hypothetical protein
VKNKPLIVAAAFTLAALVFLLWSWGAYRSAAAEADDAIYDWESSANSRKTFVDMRAAAASLQPRASQAGDDVTAMMGKLITDCGLQISQLDRIDPAGTVGNEKSAHNVKLSGISIATMGDMLERVRTQYSNLLVREIIMNEPKDGAPGYFNWTLLIGVPKPEK